MSEPSVDNYPSELIDEQIDDMESMASEAAMDSNAMADMDTSTDNIPLLTMEIPIDISVQLGKLAIDVGRVGSLSSGDILELQTDTPGYVSLIYEGREIGQGQLVDVEGNLGVQIIKNWCRQ